MRKRRITAVVLALALLFGLTGCSLFGAQESSLADRYLDKATEYISAGDLDTAVRVLEEGVAATDAGALKAALEKARELQAEANAKQPQEAENEATQAAVDASVYDATLEELYQILKKGEAPGAVGDIPGAYGMMCERYDMSEEERLNSCGYCVQDVNGDGVAELLITDVNPDGTSGKIRSAFTAGEGKAVCFLETCESDYYYLIGDGEFFYYLYSCDGDFGVYRLEPDAAELTCKDLYFSRYNGESGISYHHNTTGEYDIEASEQLDISREQYGKISMELELKEKKLPVIRFSEYQSKAGESKAVQTFDVTPYLGTWAAEGSCYENGGFVVTISENGGTVAFNCRNVGGPPYCRIAEVSWDVAADKLSEASLTHRYDNDGWGNSGVIALTLDGDKLNCTISDVVHDPNANMSLPEATNTLTKMDDAWDGMAEPVNLFIVDSEAQYRVNLFLSSFSEQRFDSYDTNTAEDKLVDFARLYSIINAQDRIEYDSVNGIERLSRQNADAVLQFFFGKKTSHSNADQMITDWIEYGGDGYYYWFAATGEAYNRLTVADKMTLNDDGSYKVKFTIYEIDLGTYYDGSYGDMYEMNYLQAGMDPRLNAVGNGEATLADYTASDGTASFHLIKYHCNV